MVAPTTVYEVDDWFYHYEYVRTCMAIKPVTEFARILDEAKVPNVLWGKHAVVLHADASRRPELIVPDDLIEVASNAIAAAGYEACLDKQCPERQIFQRKYPVADAHFHFHNEYCSKDECTMSLFAKSRLLWWLPDFQLGPPAVDDPDLLLSTDMRIPPYRFASNIGPWIDLYPVKALNQNSYLEAMLRLYIRDCDHMNSFDECWLYFIHRCEEDREFSEQKEPMIKRTMRPSFHKFWHARFERSPAENRAALRDLRMELEKLNEMPPPPPVNSYGALAFAVEANKRTGPEMPENWR
ncbi:uncharacterized protein N7459_002263 [Penicillium hispanicum]|uniref:uncharacterized protein n=1 Tax=Penicillium hispanicum TaxID=1080232 RepID=UPI00254268C9|nr:uncharacterized protein N7459_002263 [Penicillium hispanicum]KAJ5591894.1 hypothetical protein N7459_002263 [Penicillium hispanicum]